MSRMRGVLLMAYGTPERLEDVADYFTHIRRGRRPSDEAIANLQARYTRIGGATPLRRITEAVRDGLRSELVSSGEKRAVFVGMKHWHPFIEEAVQAMSEAGVQEVVALALAPHYSHMSVGAYRHAVEEANAALPLPLDITFVRSWYDEPGFVELMADRVRAALAGVAQPGEPAPTVVFTAHSLPVRIRESNDPYEAQLLDSAAMVAAQMGLSDWRFAWQSAGGTTEPWIGPDILDYLETLSAEGVRTVVQVPIGFVSDHLEILYDIDIEAKERATELGMRLGRTQLPNADPDFIRALSAVVLRSQTGSAVGSPTSSGNS